MKKAAKPNKIKKTSSSKQLFLLNIIIRVALIYFLIETVMLPNDPRFEGKAIPVRNLVIVGSLSLLFPIWWLLNRKKKAGYPFFADSLYLSIFLFDMAGNSFNLYDGLKNFDILAHFHGAGAFTAVCFLALTAKKIPLKKAMIYALLIGIALHSALEIQEYLTDVFFGTHNVNGWQDTAHDLAAGLFGSITYMFLLKEYAKNNRQTALRSLVT